MGFVAAGGRRVETRTIAYGRELFKVVDGRVRITLQPNQYVWLPVNARNKHYEEYGKGRASELLITDRKVCLTFVVQRATEPLDRIARIQNDFSRRRRALQKHVKNPKKRTKKLRETRGRQRNRIKDVLQKLSTRQVRENPSASFVFENLRGIRRNNGGKKSKRFRTYLNRWPYRLYQSMVEYKSPNHTLYVSPQGTSSECPVCGGRLEHPVWAVSRCVKCGVDYDRDRLASLAILCRGLRLCGQPFAVSADASWQQMRDEYLYAGGMPDDAIRAGWTDAASAPNGNVVYESTRP